MDKQPRLKSVEKISRLTSGIVLAAGAAACSSSVSMTVDCEKSPRGTVSVTATPGRKSDIDFGYAKIDDDGNVKWRAKVTLVQDDNGFDVIAGTAGLGPELKYQNLPGPNAEVDLFHFRDNLGWVDAHTTGNFNTSNKLDPHNEVVVVWHCGTRPAGQQ